MTKHEYYIKNKKTINEKNKLWYRTHKNQAHENSRKYYLKNKERIDKYQKNYKKKWLLLNPNYMSEYTKKYNKENYIKLKKYRRIYKRNNRNKIQEIKRNNLKINIRFRIKENLRARIYHALKSNIKSLNTMFLIGCEIDYLMFHIQEQFTEGMTWDNYGDWHIDHIIPCDGFDLIDPEQQKECFHYTNLQPLWAIDNLRKGYND